MPTVKGIGRKHKRARETHANDNPTTRRDADLANMKKKLARRDAEITQLKAVRDRNKTETANTLKRLRESEKTGERAERDLAHCAEVIARLRKRLKASRQLRYLAKNTRGELEKQLVALREKVSHLTEKNQGLNELVQYLENTIEVSRESASEAASNAAAVSAAESDSKQEPEKANFQLWDEKRGVSGGFSTSLRLLIMKLRGENIAISRIARVIAVFCDHFDLDVDLSHLPSTRVVGRILKYELDIVCNAQIGYAIGSSAVDEITQGNDGSTKNNKHIGLLSPQPLLCLALCDVKVQCVRALYAASGCEFLSHVTGTNQIYIEQVLYQMDVSELPNGTAESRAEAMVEASRVVTRDALVALPQSMLTKSVRERIERPLYTYVAASISDQAKAELCLARLVNQKGIAWLREHREKIADVFADKKMLLGFCNTHNISGTLFLIAIVDHTKERVTIPECVGMGDALNKGFRSLRKGMGKVAKVPAEKHVACNRTCDFLVAGFRGRQLGGRGRRFGRRCHFPG